MLWLSLNEAVASELYGNLRGRAAECVFADGDIYRTWVSTERERAAHSTNIFTCYVYVHTRVTCSSVEIGA